MSLDAHCRINLVIEALDKDEEAYILVRTTIRGWAVQFSKKSCAPGAPQQEGRGMQSFGLWIEGKSRPALRSGSFERSNPFDRSSAGTFANAQQEDAEEAIAAARRAFDDGPWPTSSARTRYEVLTRAAAQLDAHRQVFAERMVLESGKPIT